LAEVRHSAGELLNAGAGKRFEGKSLERVVLDGGLRQLAGAKHADCLCS
jgi:hypothetical protein